jgi:hypothetical protein
MAPGSRAVAGPRSRGPGFPRNGIDLTRQAGARPIRPTEAAARPTTALSCLLVTIDRTQRVFPTLPHHRVGPYHGSRTCANTIGTGMAGQARSADQPMKNRHCSRRLQFCRSSSQFRRPCGLGNEMPGSWRGDTCREASMPTIALVDDDHNILTSVSTALEAEVAWVRFGVGDEFRGYRTITYTDGSSALDGFKSSPPDLAILDIKISHGWHGDVAALAPDVRCTGDLPHFQGRGN